MADQPATPLEARLANWVDLARAGDVGAIRRVCDEVLRLDEENRQAEAAVDRLTKDNLYLNRMLNDHARCRTGEDTPMGPDDTEPSEEPCRINGGRIIHMGHNCNPPKDTPTIKYPPGTIWECDCGQRWKADGRWWSRMGWWRATIDAIEGMFS